MDTGTLAHALMHNILSSREAIIESTVIGNTPGMKIVLPANQNRFAHVIHFVGFTFKFHSC